MSNDIPNECVNFKDAQGLSNSAKLLAGYMAATGIADAKAISAKLGIPVRTIQRLKLDIACVQVVSASANDANSAMDGAANSANCATDGVDQTADKKVSPTPPSKNITTTTTIQPVAAREPDGWAELKAEFNGSTAAMVEDVRRWMGPIANKADAVKWLGGTLSAFGRSRTAQAWTIVVAKVAKGEDVRNALPLWAKTAKGLKDDPVAAASALENPFAEQTKGVVRFAKAAPRRSTFNPEASGHA